MTALDPAPEGAAAHLAPSSWRRNRVPAEHRLLGLDRRTFPWAFAVIALALLWTVVLPAVDERVDYDDPVRAGERFAVTDDLAITPPAGWNVDSGFRVSDDPAAGEAEPIVLTSGGMTFQASADSFSGTPDDLLDQVDAITTTTGGVEAFHTTSDRTTVTTDSGLVGVAEGFTSRRSQGVIVAFVDDGKGIEMQLVGTPDQMSALSDDVAAMVESLGPRDTSGEEAG